MRVKPIEINWHPDLPVFAKESFLKAVSDEYGWLGGVSDSGELRCVLPYTIIKKSFMRLVRFRVETIQMGTALDIDEEKSFLNSVIEYFRSLKLDVIIPASNNALFRVFPDGADAAPYGSYLIDLSQPEDILWRNIDRITRQNINTARKKGVIIRSNDPDLDTAYALVG
jgi:hypothetical protein